MEEEES